MTLMFKSKEHKIQRIVYIRYACGLLSSGYKKKKFSLSTLDFFTMMVYSWNLAISMCIWLCKQVQDLDLMVYFREGSVNDAGLKAYLERFGEVIKVKILYACFCVHALRGWMHCVGEHNDKSMHWSVYEQVPPWRSRQRISLIIWRLWVQASQVALFLYLFIFFPDGKSLLTPLLHVSLNIVWLKNVYPDNPYLSHFFKSRAGVTY